MTELAPDRIKKIAHIISEVSPLDETDMFILLALLSDSKIPLRTRQNNEIQGWGILSPIIREP